MTFNVGVLFTADGTQLSAEGKRVAEALRSVGNQSRLTGQHTAALSAQLQDLFVQLQSGQSPLTALLQQGSQLSGQFGGIRNAAKTLAAAVGPVGLVLGGIATVVATGVVAYQRGIAETDAYRKALLLTGNAAGTTIGELQRITAAVSSLGGTQGRAAEVLTQLASSAKVGRGQLHLLTEAAIGLERAGGPAAEETAKAFEQLARSPSQAAESLNESVRFLTASTYEQIRALELHGRHAEAAAIAQTALATTLKVRAAELDQHLGSLQRGWRAVADAAKGAWDSMLNVGRQQSVGEMLEQLDAALAKRAPRETRRGTVPRAQLAEVYQDKTGFEDRNALNAAGGYEALNAYYEKSRRNAEDARRELLKFGESLRAHDPSQQLKAQIRTVEQWGETIRESGGDAAAVDKQVRAVIGTLTAYSQAASISIATAQARIAGMSQRDSIRAASELAALQAQREQGLLTEVQLIDRVADAELRALAAQKQRIEETIRATPTLPQSAAARAGLDESLKSLDAQIDQRQVQRANDLATAIYRIKAAADAAARAQQEQYGTELAAYYADVEQRIAGVADAIHSYGLGIQDAAYAHGIELQAMQQSDRQRAITLGQLQIELQRRERLRALGAQRLPVDDPRVRLAAEQINQQAAQQSEQLVDRVTQEFRQRGAIDIQRSLIDALEGGFSSGWEYFKRLAKREWIRVYIEPYIRPFASGLAGALPSIAGASDGVGPAGSATSATGTLQWMQAGRSLWDGFSSGFSGIGSGVANAYGVTYANATGGGLDALLATNNAYGTAGGAGGTGTALGSVATVAAGAIAGHYAGRAISGGYSATGGSGNSTVNAGTTVGGAIGSIWGPVGAAVGAAIGGAIGGVVNRAFGRRAPEIESRELAGTFDGAGDFSGNRVTNVLERGGWFRSDRRSQQLEAVTGDVDKALDEGGRSIVDLARRYGQALGLPVEQLADITRDIRVSISDDAQETQRAIEDALKGYADVLLESFAPSLEPLRRAGESTAQVIERVGGTLLGVNDVLRTLGLTAYETSVAGGEASVKLIDLFGGLGGLQQTTAQYYQAFYSDAERANRATGELTRVLGTLNLELPTSRDGYRALVEAQDRNTDAGRQAFATLLGLSGAFDQVTAAGERVREEAERERERVLGERGNLEKQLLQLQGNTTELRRLERDALDRSNRALYDQVMALQDAREAADAANAVVSERSGLERQLLQLQGNTAEVRRLERDALDESNRALFDHVQALQDQAVAAQRAAEQAAELQGAIDTATLRYLRDPAARQAYGHDMVARDLQSAGVLVGYGQADVARSLEVLSRDRIAELVVEFVNLTNVTHDQRLAVVRAGEALLELRDEAGEAARQLADAAGAKLKDFISGLDDVLGTRPRTGAETLADMLRGRAALRDYRRELAGQIDAARLEGMTPVERVAALRARETIGIASIGSSSDPVAAAQAVHRIMLDRIREEAALREQMHGDEIASLRERINGVERLRDIGRDLLRTVDDLSFSDLSAYGYDRQLAEARGLYERTRDAARAADPTAASQLGGVATSYLQELERYSGHAGDYGREFERVMGELRAEGVALSGYGSSGEAARLETQLQALSGTGQSTVDGLTAIQDAMDRRAVQDEAALARQARLLEEEIAELRETNRLLREMAGLSNDLSGEEQALQARVVGALERIEEHLMRVEARPT